MAAYKIMPFAKGSTHLLTLQSVVRSNTIEKLMKTTTNTILTTVHHQTHGNHQRQIKALQANDKIKVVPFYYPLIYAHHSRTQSPFSDNNRTRNISLIVGENDNQIISKLNKNKFMTLQQLCAAFPQQVPLSYRPKDSNSSRQILQKRIGYQLNNAKAIQFESLLIINPDIKMWDEAFQVILDCQPSPVYIPYLKQQTKEQGQYYRLNLEDFVKGLKIIHQTVSKAVKNHPELNLKIFDQKKQLNWLINHIAPETSEMTIDQYFFTTKANIAGCEGKVKVKRIDQIV